MKRLAILRANPLNDPCFGLDIEGAGRSHCDSSYIGSDLLALCDDGPHHIPGLKAFDLLVGFGFASWEAKLVDQAHLTVSMPVCSNEEWHYSLDLEYFRRPLAHARGI